MAHTINHPFSGSDITSCSYGAQAVSKAAKVVKPTKTGKPLTQSQLATKWIKEFDSLPDGPIVTMTNKWGDYAFHYKKEGGKLFVQHSSKGVGRIGTWQEEQLWSKKNYGELLKDKVQVLSKDKYSAAWEYPASASEGLGVTEAGFESANAAGSWETVAAKSAKGELKANQIIAEGVDEVGDEWRILSTGDDDKWLVQIKTDGKWGPTNKFQSKDWVEKNAFGGDGGPGLGVKWKFKTTKGSPPAVSPSSTSIGAMTDEDAAKLFVQIKDDLAAKRGLNIKGVNKALDDAVYKKIAELTGYKPEEILAKVERYKANGNKLSALKKKQMKSGEKVDATKYAKKETVDTAVKELSDPKVTDSLGVYTDEDVAKAYIKAKDHVASLDDNPWTLYTPDSNAAFEKAIRQYMKDEYGVDVTNTRLKQHLADYIANNNKLSVLKKQMVKAGEMEKKADTLKGKSQFDFITSKEGAGDNTVSVGSKKYKKSANEPTAEELADIGYTPSGSKVHTFNDLEERQIFVDIKPGTYLTSSPEEIYGKLLSKQAELAKEGKDVSILDLLRIFDRQGAKKLGVPDEHLYEKKVAQWASTPEGRASIKAKQEAEKALANQPALPADSTLFREISTREATQMQEEMGRWTAQEKAALRHYTGSNYHEMNGALRQGRVSSSYEKANIINAWKGMKPSTRDVITHRGTSYSAFGPNVHSASDLAKLTGKTFEEKGFSSTSVGGNAAFGGNVHLIIESPKGTYMAYVDNISMHRGEREMLLPPHTHFQILQVTNKGYQTEVRVRVVHTEKYKGQLG